MIKYVVAIVIIVGGYFYIGSQKMDLSKPDVEVNAMQEKSHQGHGHSHEEGFAPQGSYPEVQSEFDLKRFSDVFPGEWTGNYLEEGFIVLKGGKIPLKVAMDGAVLALTQKIAAQFGVNPKQVSPQVDRSMESTDNPYFTTYQHHDGMLVHDSSMKIFFDKEKKEVHTLKISFKKIDQLNLIQTIGLQEAWKKFNKHNFKLLGRGETVISVDMGKGNAAYRFFYEDKKRGKRVVLLSATDGYFITDVPLQWHERN